MKRRQLELKTILDSYNEQLADKVITEITRTNYDAMQEIYKRNLGNIRLLQDDQRPVDYFLESILFVILEKLHRGDRFKAFQILEQVRTNVYNL